MTTSPTLHTETYGSPHAPTLLFLHGGGVSGWMWQPVIEALPDYHCLVPDLPEYGGSADVGPFSIALAAEKTAEIIRTRAHGGKATVVGLSIGAQIAVQLLATAPELVEKAIISSALLLPIHGTGWMNNREILKWTYRLSIPPFKNNDWWIRLNMQYSAGIDDAYFTQFKRDFQTTSESAFVNLMIENQSFRKPEGLENATAPALIVTGKKEFAAMQRSAQILAETLPNAKRVQLDLGKKTTMAGEHNWALSTPNLFAQTVRAWVEGAELPDVIRSGN